MSKYNTDWLVETLKKKGIKALPLEEYIDDKTPIKFKCLDCDWEWIVDPSHLKSGRTCPNCKKLNKRKQAEQNFIERATKIHNNKYIYEKIQYVKQQQKITITCRKHGDFEQTPAAHLRRQGCPLCAGNNFLRDREYFINLAKQKHGTRYDYSLVDYKNCKSQVIIKCNKCGNTFQQTPDKHLAGQGCPKCRLKSQSILFDKLRNVFNEDEILWEASPKWLDNQRFDIYFPKYNIAVEYDGKQHFVPVKQFGGNIGLAYTQQQDRLKEAKCLQNNCTLFRIKYDYTDQDFTQLCYNIKNIITHL